jgi:glycosyltransferase involved in cell wall biosynthesis
MKVLYDHQIFMLQNYGGISRYFYELMNSYNKHEFIKFDLALKYSNNYYINDAGFSNHKPFFKDINFKGRNTLYNFTNTWNSKRYLNKKNFDIYHPTYYDTYFLNCLGNKPFVLTIHDMIHEIYKENFTPEDKTAENKKLLASKASKIIAVSQNTKKDIVRFYGISEEKIAVVYHGNSLDVTKLGSCVKVKLPPKYILFVGLRDGYKNFKNFIRAASSILIEDKELEIVCIGGGAFKQDEKKLLESLNIQDKVFQHSVDDRTLNEYYKNALMFVYPSDYEGFGIPILEAFTCGCPIALSNTSCFPEVAEDCAIYFDPNDNESIRDSICNIIYDSSLRQDLIKKGYKQVKKFSWEKASKETMNVYESVL